MKRLNFENWSNTVLQQIPLTESDSLKTYNLESWITEGKLHPVENNNFKPSTLEELVKAGLVE